MNRKVKYLIILILLVSALFAVLFFTGVFKFNEEESEYEKNPSKVGSHYNLKELKNSDAAYLLEPNFEVTEDNLNTCLKDFFAAPSRLYFTYDIDDNQSVYKCDDLKINAGFADIFANVDFMTCSKEDYDAVEPYNLNPGASDNNPALLSEKFLGNKIGDVIIVLVQGHSYLCFGTFNRDFSEYKQNYFYTEEDLSEAYRLAEERALPYAKEIEPFERE